MDMGEGRVDVHFLGTSKILLCLKSNTFEIKVELLPFIGKNGEMVNGETNVFKLSSSTERI